MSGKKIVIIALALVLLAGGAFAFSNSSQLQGSFSSAKGSGLPDLTSDMSNTSYLVSGSGTVDSSGNVVSIDIVGIGNCGIKNNSPIAASGTQYTTCTFSVPTPSGSTMSLTRPNLAGVLSLAPNAFVTFTKTSSVTPSAMSMPDYLIFAQPLYNTGASRVTVTYAVDYATTYNIAEANETNNTPSAVIAVDGSGITWTVVDSTTTSSEPPEETTSGTGEAS